jgi:hypothetical protein
VSTFVAYVVARHTSGLSLQQERTTATLVLAASAVLVLARVARPIRMWKVVLIAAMAAFLALCTALEPLRKYFELDDPPAGTMWTILVIVAITGLLLPAVWRLGDRSVAVAEGWYHSRQSQLSQDSQQSRPSQHSTG